jgi:hypothetical protein
MVQIGITRVIAALLLLSGVASCAAAEAAAPEVTIPEPTWFSGWDNELGHSAVSSRKLMQPGLFTPGHTGSSACNVAIVGTGALNKVKSAKVSCVTTDDYWRKRNGGKIVVYAGKPLYNLYKSQPANWKGIQLNLPNEPDFLGKGNSDAVLFWVQAGKVHFTGSVTSMNVVDWAVMHIENGTEPTFNNFTWSGNVGQRFPTLAAARANVYVNTCKFINNVCTVPRCHTPGIYLTEGARMRVTNTLFQNGRGHLAGAVMITSGAIGNITKSTFKGNQVTVNGAFGGAIFHDFCDKDKRAKSDRSFFTANTFVDNKSAGFGGAIRIGSPQGSCPRTVIQSNTFQNNMAQYTGGAIHIAYCNNVRASFPSNKFIGNKATKFNGQVGYNPKTYPKGQPGYPKPTPAGAGCQDPLLTGSTFSGTGTAKFSPAWFFP